MNEIISFPKDRIVRESPQLNEELAKAKQKGVQNFCDQLTDEAISILIDVLDNSGIDTDADLFQRDMALTGDSLRATIYRSMNLSHHLHEFIDNHLTIVRREELENENGESDEPSESDKSDK